MLTFSCKKLTGQEMYRLWQGQYRILYSTQDKELTVWLSKSRPSKEYISLRNKGKDYWLKVTTFTGKDKQVPATSLR